jgi:hypothetical protein
MTQHNPVAPSWICTGCGGEWPCRTRRTELRAEFDGSRVSLSLYMAQFFVVAAEDLRYVPGGLLHNRFVGWIRHPEEPIPYTSVDILLHGQALAVEHLPDSAGRCPSCGDQDNCWVRLNPTGPRFRHRCE